MVILVVFPGFICVTPTRAAFSPTNYTINLVPRNVFVILTISGYVAMSVFLGLITSGVIFVWVCFDCETSTQPLYNFFLTPSRNCVKARL